MSSAVKIVDGMKVCCLRWECRRVQGPWKDSTRIVDNSLVSLSRNENIFSAVATRGIIETVHSMAEPQIARYEYYSIRTSDGGRNRQMGD